MKDKTTKSNAPGKEKEKEVKKINVKPLMPLQRLNSQKKLEMEISGNSPKEKSQPPGSIHEILEQMTVSPNNPEARAGKMAADRWKNRTARQIYDDFCTDTSFTALTRIHKASHWYKRILWLVACLCMLTWLTIQCIWLFQKFFSYPVEVKIEMEAVPNLAFPSVTVCNLNPVKRSQIYRGAFQNISHYFELNDDDMLYDDFVEDQMRQWEEENSTYFDDEEYMKTFMREHSFNKWDSLENNTELAKEFYSEMDESHQATFAYSATGVTMETAEFKSYGHQEQDLIIACTFQGMPCSPKNFTYHRNHLYGNCYTINTFDNGNTPLSTNYAGPLMGLLLELNIEQDEYIAALSPDAGVRITVHPRGSYPFPEDDGISVSPGFKTSIGIAKTEITRLPPPHGECGAQGVEVTDMFTRDFGTQYSKQTCLKSCMQQLLMERCGCMTSYFYIPENGSVCSNSNGNESSCMDATLCSLIDQCSKRCPTPCHETKFEFTSSMSKWPSKQYEDHLDRKIRKSMSDFMDDDNMPDSDDTLAKVEIYFKELVYEKIEASKAYESQNLISDIGGQLGLWLGLSAITVGEIFEFFAALFKLICYKMFSQRHPGTAPLSNTDLA